MLLRQITPAAAEELLRAVLLLELLLQ